MKSKLQDNRGITLVVVLVVMVILLSVIGAGLLFSGINTKITANYQTGTKAFYAADTGINAAINQLALDPSVATAALSKNMGGGLAYRSGHRTDTVPQPLVFLRTQSQSGYSLGSGTGYNPSGYNFYEYQINVTGTYTTTYGTELAGREVEAIASYGPVPK
ncbi:MAG: PilX N-terminal domain-containing pilus assembly protein [Alphaproteobacteria bacterium]